MRGGTGKCEWLPTPEDIRRTCREIQAEWPVDEHWLRRGWFKGELVQGLHLYSVPTVRKGSAE